MSEFHIVRLHDTPAQPWRNGGGVTHELLAWPTPAPWQLRVSVAHIDRSGPFSPFPGVTRWFTVLDGDGVRLDLPQRSLSLLAGDDPIAFDGEAAPDCHLLGGPTLDLNLMAPRDAGSLHMQRALAGSSVAGPTRWRGLYAAATVLLEIEGIAEPVQGGTLLWSDSGDAADWQLHHASSGLAYWMTLET